MNSHTAVQDGTKVIKSVCRGCHGGCSVLLHVKDGQLVKVKGDPDGPLNRGRLCQIGAVARDLVYHPDRLHHPLRRIGPRGSGEWERITWDEALDEIALKLNQIRTTDGPEAIVLGQGTGRHHYFHTVRFANAIGTPNWTEPGFAQCFLPRVTASLHMFGDFPVCDLIGDVKPQCIMYWGHNPTNSGPDGETRFNVRDSLLDNPKIPNLPKKSSSYSLARAIQESLTQNSRKKASSACRLNTTSTKNPGSIHQRGRSNFTRR
ncbi:MAG: molybdopterin-dependent oxidoreductase [Sterolibacterium sp.]